MLMTRDKPGFSLVLLMASAWLLGLTFFGAWWALLLQWSERSTGSAVDLGAFILVPVMMLVAYVPIRSWFKTQAGWTVKSASEDLKTAMYRAPLWMGLGVLMLLLQVLVVRWHEPIFLSVFVLMHAAALSLCLREITKFACAWVVFQPLPRM